MLCIGMLTDLNVDDDGGFSSTTISRSSDGDGGSSARSLLLRHHPDARRDSRVARYRCRFAPLKPGSRADGSGAAAEFAKEMECKNSLHICLGCKERRSFPCHMCMLTVGVRRRRWWQQLYKRPNCSFVRTPESGEMMVRFNKIPLQITTAAASSELQTNGDLWAPPPLTFLSLFLAIDGNKVCAINAVWDGPN